jgi:hypothetical protein
MTAVAHRVSLLFVAGFNPTADWFAKFPADRQQQKDKGVVQPAAAVRVASGFTW